MMKRRVTLSVAYLSGFLAAIRSTRHFLAFHLAALDHFATFLRLAKKNTIPIHHFHQSRKEKQHKKKRGDGEKEEVGEEAHRAVLKWYCPFSFYSQVHIWGDDSFSYAHMVNKLAPESSFSSGN
ncbi:hypothetical protein V8C44DRAFT_276928 [Trichoderma aethiopicum]